jgi:hypothetical protein
VRGPILVREVYDTDAGEMDCDLFPLHLKVFLLGVDGTSNCPVHRNRCGCERFITQRYHVFLFLTGKPNEHPIGQFDFPRGQKLDHLVKRVKAIMESVNPLRLYRLWWEPHSGRPVLLDWTSCYMKSLCEYVWITVSARGGRVVCSEDV